MKQDIEKTVEETVVEVLSKHYPNFDAEANSGTVARIVTLINDPDKKYRDVEAGFESDAAYLTRMVLLEVFRHGTSSVQATVDIFNALERSPELGWLTD